MGAGQSGATELGGSSMGYQVLRVYPNSPGSRAGLKAYFDFIIAIGTTRFNKENGSLREILKASVDQKMKMTVLNTRTKRTREVEIVPSTSWGGNGLLGVSIKHSSFDRADEKVWHVVEVEPGSPAYQAGFKANEDYVIGSDSILQENDDLYNLVEAHEGKALKLFLYNVNTDNCREVVCHPNSKWGGKGYLGCEFGHGLLHRIPYGDEANGENVAGGDKASLLRNEQPVATQELHNGSNNTSMTFQNQLMQQQLQQLQKPTQPGQQLFQQALFNNQSQQLQQLSQQPTTPQLPQQQMSQLSLGNEPQQQQAASQQSQQALQPINHYSTNYQQQPPPPSQPQQQLQSHQHQMDQQQPHQPYYQQQPAAPYQQQPPPQSYVHLENQAQQQMPEMSYLGQHPFSQPEPPKEQPQQSYQQPSYQHQQLPPLPLSQLQQQQHQQQQAPQYLPNQQPQQHYRQPAPPPPPPPQLQHSQYQPQQQHHQSYQQQPPPPPPPQLSPPQAQQQQPPPPPPQVPQTFAQLAAASQFQPTSTPQFCPSPDGKTGAAGGGAGGSTVLGPGEGGELSNSNLLS